MRRTLIPVAAAASLTFALAACGDDDDAPGNDDGGTVRPINTDDGSESGSGSGSGSEPASESESGSGSEPGSGSGSGSESESGSGIEVDSDATSDDPLVIEAAAQYSAYVRGQTEDIVDDAKSFTDAVRAGDLEAAEAAYAPSRQAWERIEPIAGLVEDIDIAVDARVDDFENEDDPAWTGWHKLEYLIFDQGDIGPDSGATELADQLDDDLAELQTTMADTEVPPAAIPVGAAELIEEVSTGKITGEEDRYSGTDLWDFAANVEGSQAAFEFLEPAIEADDPELVEAIEDGFDDIEDQLEAYEQGDGYEPFSALTPDDTDTMKTTLAQLSEDLSLVAGTLGLE